MGGGSWSSTFDTLLEDLCQRRWKPGEVRQRIFFDSTVYFIWQERNGHLFRGIRRDVGHLVKDIRRVVAMRTSGIAKVRGGSNRIPLSING